jgi:cullin-associated NEDD8-dissociated protein 1
MITTDLNSLVEKCSHWDKDERYMATTDLINYMSGDVKLDENMERKICAAILKLLGSKKFHLDHVIVYIKFGNLMKCQSGNYS